MMIIRFIAILICLIQIASANDLGSFYTQHNRGWLFFEDPMTEEEKKEQQEESIDQIMQIKPGETASMAMDRIQKAYDEATNTAILVPSEKNFLRELKFITAITESSEKFAYGRGETLLKHPKLDPTLEHPTNQSAIKIAHAEKQKNNLKILAEVREKVALLFFFKEGCSYCQAYSANIDNLRKSLKLEIRAISMDRGRLHNYSGEQIDDNGISEQYEIQAVPTIAAVNPKTGKHAIITTGMVSEETLMTNLLEYGVRLLDEDY